MKAKMMNIKNKKLFYQVINQLLSNNSSFTWVSQWKKTSEYTVVTDLFVQFISSLFFYFLAPKDLLKY